MTRQIFTIITTLILQICFIVLSSIMNWETFGMVVKIGAPSFLLILGLLSINYKICNWFSQPMFKRKNNDDDLNY